MAHKTVDIKHSCGHEEIAHKVELGLHVRHSNETSVNDHLRVKPCPKCNGRNGWAWKDSAPLAKSVPVPVKESDAKPKAGKGADAKP